MKERGCGWSGTLEQLDSHLDPDQDNCQYADTKCPLNCQQTIPKNKMEQHVAEECVKRAFVCKHCSFKATYEEVVDIHLPECKYVPLQCPNRCGVTCERDFMEDHMKTCRLEEVGCEFSGVGCEEQFRREDQEEHTRQNSQQHLTYTALLAVETKEQLQQKIQEQDKKHRDDMQEVNQKVRELEKRLQDQDSLHKEEYKKLQDQDKEHKEEGEKLKQKLDEQKKLLEHFNLKLLGLTNMILKRNFEIKLFSQEKAKDKFGGWYSPAMYTHMCGYKFCIGVAANGWGNGCGNSVDVTVLVMPGEYDGLLKWPANAKFTVELIHQYGGENASGTSAETTWNKPRAITRVKRIFGDKCGTYGFIEHSKLGAFLFNDTLYFNVSSIKFI